VAAEKRVKKIRNEEEKRKSWERKPGAKSCGITKSCIGGHTADEPNRVQGGTDERIEVFTIGAVKGILGLRKFPADRGGTR